MVKRKNMMYFRVDKDYTKRKLGEKLGVSGQYIGKLENCQANGSKKFWDIFKLKFNLTDEKITELKKMEK